MGVNLTEQTLEERLVNKIAALSRQVEELKTLQPVGGANIVINRELSIGSLTYTIPNGTSYAFIHYIYYPTHPSYYITEIAPVLYVTNYGNYAYRWPVGSSLTSAEKAGLNIQVAYAPDVSTETVDGTKAYVVYLTNNTGASQTVYVDLFLLYPAL